MLDAYLGVHAHLVDELRRAVGPIEWLAIAAPPQVAVGRRLLVSARHHGRRSRASTSISWLLPGSMVACKVLDEGLIGLEGIARAHSSGN